MKSQPIQTFSMEFYTEGPAMDAEGNVFFTTLMGGSIMKIDLNGQLSKWTTAVCPNGQIILQNGDHIICDSTESVISRYHPNGDFVQHEISGTCNGLRVFVPNDLIADQSGGIYFTDSIRNDGKVCYIANDGSEYIVATGLDYPNGIALSRNEDRLYVAESYKNRILSISLIRAGIASDAIEILAELPRHESRKEASNLPDGIALDNHNRLWVAHYGMSSVQVLHLDGKSVGTLQIPFPLVSNVFVSTHNPSELMVTGGYGEPGPGAVIKFSI